MGNSWLWLLRAREPPACMAVKPSQHTSPGWLEWLEDSQTRPIRVHTGTLVSPRKSGTHLEEDGGGRNLLGVGLVAVRQVAACRQGAGISHVHSSE